MAAKPKGQLAKFKQAARELGTDDSEKRFNEKLGKIARQKPSGALLPKRAASKKSK